MAKDRNTYAKRVRETEQKRKAEEKRARRQRRKEQPDRLPEAPADESPAVESR